RSRLGLHVEGEFIEGKAAVRRTIAFKTDFLAVAQVEVPAVQEVAILLDHEKHGVSADLAGEIKRMRGCDGGAKQACNEGNLSGFAHQGRQAVSAGRGASASLRAASITERSARSTSGTPAPLAAERT